MQSHLQYDCSKCNDRDKEARGCDYHASTIVMVHGVKGHTTRCPVIDANEMGDYFRIYQYWQKGQFPNRGTWAEQPYRLVMIMEAINGFTHGNPD